MSHVRPLAVLLLAALGTLPLAAQEKSPAETAIVTAIKGLRALPDAERGPRTGSIALEIRALPASPRKLSLALGLANLSTEGDPGRDNLQAVTTTLAQAVTETPAANEKDGAPAAAYMELAQLARFEGMNVSLTNPEFRAAQARLVAQDADVAKQDFHLTDLQGKKWSLHELRGKVVVLNFWATWCPPCRRELPDLDALYKRFGSQGLVVLGISDEDAAKVAPFVAAHPMSFPVLLDPGRATEDSFHVSGIPHTYIFDRKGRLAGEAIDMRTAPQFLALLQKAGIKP